MEAELYVNTIEYDQITQSIYQAILRNKGVTNVDVKHNVKVKGCSGVKHQIDVMWQIKPANLVLIECKHYSSPISLDKVRNFFAVLQDIGLARGMMVTKVGYQNGVNQFANYYGIDLKLLRKPIKEDWEDRIKDIPLNITAKVPVSSAEHPINTQVFLSPSSEEQKQRLEVLAAQGKLQISFGPDLRFRDVNGNECTEEMRWWLPRMLDVLDKEEGGPYNKEIQLNDKYISVNPGQPDEEIVQVIGLKVHYYVETLENATNIIHGEEVVRAIMKD